GALSRWQNDVGVETTNLAQSAAANLSYTQEGVYYGGSYSLGSVTFERGDSHGGTQLTDSQLTVTGFETAGLATWLALGTPATSTATFREKNVDSSQTQLSSFTNGSHLTQTSSGSESFTLLRQDYPGFFSYTFASDRDSTSTVAQLQTVDSF